MLTLAARGKRLKGGMDDMKRREVSERRQVGDTESMVNSMDETAGGKAPWWRNVGMEEGL